MAKPTKKSASERDEMPAMMAINPAALRAWQDIMTECGRFAVDRLQHGIETQKAMLNCKNPAELMQLQTKFYQSAIKQYSEETMRLIQLMSEATGKTMGEVRSSTKRGYDDVPL